MSNTEALRAAAQAVLDRWDSPQWEWIKQGPTADLMHALRAALAQPAADIDEAQIARLHERGAVAWAGVDAADLRAGGDGMPAASGEPVAWHMRVIGCDGSADWCELGAKPPEPVQGVEALPMMYAQPAAPDAQKGAA